MLVPDTTETNVVLKQKFKKLKGEKMGYNRN